MKDAAILTKYYRNYNYGGHLQGYALHRVISEMGHSVDIIAYDVNRNPNPVYPGLLQQMRQYSFLSALRKGRQKILARCIRKARPMLEAREKLFDDFARQTGALSSLYDDASAPELAERYRLFISGSDQIWNPNAVRLLYLQNFIDDPSRKAAYAASFGRDALSDHEQQRMLPSLKRFGSIGVREKTAAGILKGKVPCEVETVLDPTMLIGPEEWEQIARPVETRRPYVLVYFFSDSLQVRRKAAEYCRRKDLDLVYIPYAGHAFNTTDMKGDGTPLADVGPREFVGLVRSAEMVLTDSFHGAVFSLIFQKPFAVFERNRKEHVSMNSRLYDLLDTFRLRYRLLPEEKAGRMEELSALSAWEKEQIECVLSKERARSTAFLERALKKAGAKPAGKIHVSGQEHECTGCGLCAEVCPVSAVRMEKNANGFTVPRVDPFRCISCGRCRRECPFTDPPVSPVSEKKAFAAYAPDHPAGSASGGIADALAARAIENGQIVYGTAWKDAGTAAIVRCTDKEQIKQLCGSKYVQSDLYPALAALKKDLSQGRDVLFFGTPCQTAAARQCVKGCTREGSGHLKTVEIICHGTPSPKLLQGYIRWQEKRAGKKIEHIGFRTRRKAGGRDFQMTTFYKDGSRQCRSGFDDPYYRLFMSGRWFRDSCYRCPFAGRRRAADLTVGDFWNVEDLPARFGCGYRVSAVCANTSDGRRLLDDAGSRLRLFPVSVKTMEKGNANMIHPSIRPADKRDVRDIGDMDSFFDGVSHAPSGRGRKLLYMLPPSIVRTAKRIRKGGIHR